MMRTRVALDDSPRGRDLRLVRSGGLAVLLALLVTVAALAQSLTFPQLTGRVVDDAGILDPATRSALDQKLADFEAKTTAQFVVVTLKSLQGTSIEDYGYQLGRHWQIGQKDKSSGVLLIVAPNERKVRIETGYGLEGTLTDAISRLIIENSILPRFRVGDFAGGINRGVDDVIQVLSGGADEFRSRAKQRPDDVPDAADAFTTLLFLFVFAIIVITILRDVYRGGGGGPPGIGGGRQRPRSGWQGPIVIPGSWPSRSWSSGSGSSGGGFSGGGGSFGGGGASGSW